MTETRQAEWIQYYIINGDLKLPPGTAAVQVAHAATTLTLHYLLNGKEQEAFRSWLETGQRKVVLIGSAQQVTNLADQGYLSVRDSQLSQGEEAPLTIVALPPLNRDDAAPLLEGLTEL
ncbi:aminoacyl-tRNA hydrolase [Paenibacillus sp. GCM10012307]|uniref:peptidyl-tRNA hydrolase n=1 Tax=Paenibacillus roseus TaxID=2798579 RepID=A0A934J0D3_9BACL|nr:aminoacyl-tRNA hydrolase [Paenibacillus roseus]MBJ6360405.1 peptidyl-tRNA hydrolase [Paenibacillus roseus]